ncbi:DMT family transporter [Aliiroseovarius sp. PrR006]|uniref:DMT family transporter n=1 Tax=Aliiroseovarius sp. PrR006 TaxID=2706883 RepID=UPI0013D204C1|nr:DMT family transporter [Aliiroseovarius sp. PrR006]NDW52254.1 DMT family transporter [Aliiroseovarius sp. PrR006]
MTGAIGSFSVMAMAGRAVSLQLDTFELMMYRSAVGLCIILAVLTLSRRWHMVSRQNLGLHFIRNLAHFAGQNLWFYALTLIPLAQVFALEFTSPLWVVFLAPFLLGERLTRLQVLCVASGFVGILIITASSLSEPTTSTGTLSAAASAVCFALTAVFTRKLTRTQSTLSILFWLTGMQLGLGVLCAGIDGSVAVPQGWNYLWLFIIGCAGLLAHTCLTQALSLAPASVVIPIDFTRLPLIALAGAVFYDEPIGVALIVGGLIIVAANIVSIRMTETSRAV